MINIQQIRQHYPEYNDMNDQQLADRLHATFYSNMPKEVFYKKIDYKPSGISNAKLNPSSLLSRLEQKPLSPLYWLNNKAQEGINDIGGGISNSVLGTLADVANIPHALIKAIPSITPPKAPFTNKSDMAYKIGDMAGNTAAFLGGGEGVDAARGASELIPYVGKVAKSLGGTGVKGVARRAIGSGAYGAVTNPQNRTTAAIEGAAFSPLMDLPGAIKHIRPWEYAQTILQKLGSGKNIEDNAKSLASDIRNVYKTKQGIANDNYNFVYNSVPNTPIYSPIINAKAKINPNIAKYYTPSLKKVHQDFLKNPTFNNATNLRKQLNSTFGNILEKGGKSGLDQADRTALEHTVNIKNRLDQDINNFFDNLGQPHLKDAYRKANQYYENEIVPYHNPKIIQISKGTITNPRNLTTIFRNPEPDILKVVDDLGDSARNKILYNELGKTTNQLPEKLLAQYQKLNDKGLGEYITPELENNINTLTQRLNNKKGAHLIGGAVMGGTLMPHLSVERYPEILGGGGAGAWLVPHALNILQKFPLQKISQPIEKGLKIIYPSAKKAILANVLKGTN